MSEVRIPAFAKINLRLEILGKRDDGFHELRTIFQTVSLHDTLTLRSSRKLGIALQVAGNEALSGEPVEKNLVYRAVDRARQHLGDTKGVEIKLEKKTPAGRGLGGGSSDAAAALLGYLQLRRKRLPVADLLEIASPLGADVSFFLFGGRALGIGKGDELYPLPDIPKRSLLIVSPAKIHVPTPDAYRWLKAPALSALTKEEADPKLRRFCALCWSVQGGSLTNDFEDAVFAQHPRLGEIKRDLLHSGASEALLAGSGSAVFGIYPSPAKARRAAVRFPHDQTFVCETISRPGYLRRLKYAPVV